MKKFAELAFPSPDPASPFTDRLRLAVAAYLARFKGSSREHTESDLRCYLAWCAEHGLDPLDAQRPHLELYIRWMQEICQFKPSTISRRFPVTTGFYRTCAIDGVLQALTCRARPPPHRTRRITHPGLHPPAAPTRPTPSSTQTQTSASPSSLCSHQVHAAEGRLFKTEAVGEGHRCHDVPILRREARPVTSARADEMPTDDLEDELP
jgi:hypothetical protein